MNNAVAVKGFSLRRREMNADNSAQNQWEGVPRPLNGTETLAEAFLGTSIP